MSKAADETKFDCVEMKHRAAEAIYECIKDMTPDEEIAYWKKVADDFLRERNNDANGYDAPTLADAPASYSIRARERVSKLADLHRKDDDKK